MAKEKILIVEDEGIVILHIKKALESLGYKVAGIASSGEDAVVKASESKPDLVLMDISLPVMDGYEATRAIRKMFSSLPIIGLSAHAMQGDAEKAKAAGCTDYLTKPVDENKLFEMLKQYLG